MPIPANISYGSILVSSSSSIQGLNVSGGDNDYIFGTVSQTAGGSSSYQVGTSVLFKYKRAINLIYSNNRYFLISEDDIILTETTPIEA